jgi:hypothetical protein
MFIRLPITQRAYDWLLASLQLDRNPPAGEILHVAAHTGDAFEVCEIWQTRESAERFLHDVLEPALGRVGLDTPVQHLISPLYNLYAPDLDTIERIGVVSLPGVSPGSALR